MTSSINPNNINGNYPVAGQDNDSQGFRDNFTNVKNNLTFAKNEIEDLQSKAILTSALIGGTTPINNMAGAALVAPKLKNATEAVNQAVASSGSLVIDYSLGHLHYTTIDSTSGSVTVAFTNWPTQTNGYGRIRLYITVASTAYTMTLPSSVSINLSDIAGTSGQVITFPSPGKYFFEFSSYDAGATVIIQDLLRNYESQVGNAVTMISATITGNTKSNSATTGALIVAGGVGIAGNLSTGGARIEAGYQYSAATTGFNIATTSNVSRVIFDPAGTLANGTLTLPSANVDATVITVSSTQTITAFQVLPNTGTTLVPSGNITLSAGTSATYFYHANETKWYKIG